MKYLIPFLLLLPGLLHADERLIGTWQSDRVLTSRFIDNNVKWPEEQLGELKQLFGNLKLIFDGKTATAQIRDHEIVVNGASNKVAGFTQTLSYRVLGSDDRSVAIETTDPASGKVNIVTYHFPSDAVMWVYVADSGNLDVHLREYFVRVK